MSVSDLVFFVKKTLKNRKVFLLLPVTNSQINTYHHSQSTPPWRFSLISSHSSLVLQSSVGWIFLTLKGFIILTLCERRPTKLQVTTQFRPWSFHFSKLTEACVCDRNLVLPLQMWQHVGSYFIYIMYNQLYHILWGHFTMLLRFEAQCRAEELDWN